jgi:myo-inositol-1(or 4)-monophosphatase
MQGTIVKEEFFDLAVRAAKSAGEITLNYFNKNIEIGYKGNLDNDLVTEVDKKSEKCIIDMVKNQYPEHVFLAEESGLTGNNSAVKWVIDPLDGTVNYAHGVPIFSVSIAVEVNGEVVVGVVLDPSRNELFTAKKGEGAFLNGKKIAVSKSAELSKSMVVTGFPYNVKENPFNCIDIFKNFLLASRALRRLGSAALDAAWVAAGRFDGFYEVALHPWDSAAGALLVTEAGGKATNFSNDNFSIYEKSVLLTNGKIHDQMKKVLQM